MGGVGVGAWVSMRLARWLAENLPRVKGGGGARVAHEPVRELVAEVLTEHRAEDTPMVSALEVALDEEEVAKVRA